MRPAATRLNDVIVTPSLYLAFELGNTEWKLGMSPAINRPVLVRSEARPARARQAVVVQETS
jgi:hypothetical protein